MLGFDLASFGQSMLPQSVGTAATTIGNNKSWLDAFSGSNLANIGGLMGGAGSLYGAYNSSKLTDASIDSTNLQNKLYMDKYNEDKKDKESLNNSFASVWGN